MWKPGSPSSSGRAGSQTVPWRYLTNSTSDCARPGPTGVAQARNDHDAQRFQATLCDRIFSADPAQAAVVAGVVGPELDGLVQDVVARGKGVPVKRIGGTRASGPTGESPDRGGLACDPGVCRHSLAFGVVESRIRSHETEIP